jgi:regulator of sirC expression with transglutaminase-like and TPR domain
MLRNLKEIYKGQSDAARLIAVLDRLLVLQPQAWSEYRDRGLAWAEQGEAARALSDLQVYLEHAEDAFDLDEVNQRIEQLRRALG